jgi:hypothetical protein
MDRPEFDSNNDTVHREVVRNYEKSKPRDPLYRQTTGRTRSPRPDISVQAIATDILSMSVDPLIKKLANRVPRTLAGTGSVLYRTLDMMLNR